MSELTLDKSVVCCPKCSKTYEPMANDNLSKLPQAGNYTTYLRAFEVEKLLLICKALNLYKRDQTPNFHAAIKVLIRQFRVYEDKANKKPVQGRCAFCNHRLCNHTARTCKISSCLCTGYITPEIIAK